MAHYTAEVPSTLQPQYTLQSPSTIQPPSYLQPSSTLQPPFDSQSPSSLQPPPVSPPRRSSQSFADDDISNPIHYSRNPRKLIAYLIPFPKPNLHGVDPSTIPDRFLIYTPPPPPLLEVAEGEKEGKVHKVQRKWQNEVRTAKQSTAKTASWKGVKSKATKGISWAMSAVKSTDIEFLNRVSDGNSSEPRDNHADDGRNDSGDETHRTVSLEQMVLIYPPSLGGPEEKIRAEFIEGMMRTKSKATKDAIIATGLLPVSAAIDICATLIWPFGGLLEIDSVWAYTSIRGAKTARSVTKRISSTPTSSDTSKATEKPSSEPSLQLIFISSSRLEILRQYLAVKCSERDVKLFSSAGYRWTPSQNGGEMRNWEDEQWQTAEVKEDLQQVMKKGARAWDKWVKGFEKNPEKALKK